jgi:hypothetical protein
MSILGAFLFGIIAVFGIKLLARSRSREQFATVETLVAAERAELARRQAAHPEAWSPETGETFMAALQNELRVLGANRVEKVAEGSVERTVYDIDDLRLTLVETSGRWEAWLGWDARHDYPASFWLAATTGSDEFPDREADHLELAEFARQLPHIVADRTRLEPIVTATGREAARRFRAELKSSS